MPWKIAKKGDKYCVVNAETGAEMHCHPTRAEALKQQAALYANKASEDVTEEDVLALFDFGDSFQFAETKTEGGIGFPKSAYLYTPSDNVSEWKLRIWEDLDKKETAAQVGRAIAAFSPGGYRGEKVQLPDVAIASIKAKLRTLWKKYHPDQDPPAHIQATEDDEVDSAVQWLFAEDVSVPFLRRLREFLSGKVSPEDLQAAIVHARGHAGGVATAKKRADSKLAFEGYNVDYAAPTAIAHYPGDGDCGLPKDDERINYRAATEIGTQCGECMFYRDGGRCIVVEGHIDEAGVCDMFSDDEAMGFDESRQFAQGRDTNGKFAGGKSLPHKFGTDVHLSQDGNKTVVHQGGQKAGHVEPAGDKHKAVREGAHTTTHDTKEGAIKAVVEHGRKMQVEKVRAISKKSSEIYDLACVSAPHTHGDWALFLPFQFAEPPKRYQYLPAPGNFISGKYGEVMLTKERNERFVRNFRDGIYDQKLPIDLEHDLKVSGAAGYVEELVLNEDFSVDAIPSWNPRGISMIEQDRFRYFSPEWYDQWVRPEDGKVFYDVAIGGALTTRPFFKEKSLRSLVATEQGLAIIEKEGDMSREAPPTNDNPTPVSMSEMQEQLRQANERAEAAEAKAATESKQMAERLQVLEDERTSMRFSEMARGKAGEDDGKPWIGPVDTHVKTLMHIAKTAGEDSDLFKEYVATQRSNAELMRQNRVFSVIGSDQALDTTRDASAEDQLVAKAQALVDEGKAKTLSEAQEQIVLANPDLYRQATERHYR